MEATIGISAARTTICAMVLSNRLITNADRKAEHRFTDSQGNRVRIVSTTVE